MKYTDDMASDGTIYVVSFTKIVSGIQVILPLLFQNLRGCSFGITNGKPSGHYIHTKNHDDWFRHSSNNKGITSTI
jgi:hypothetical protein